MNKTLQLLILVCTCIMFVIIIVTTRKNKLFNKYSVLWLLWSIVLILISIFPQIIYFFSNLFGFEKPVNAIFLLAIFILYCLSFNVFITLSKQHEEIVSLNYELAKIKEKIEQSSKK